MEQELAAKLAQEIGVNVEQVVREEWELLILKELFESPLGNNLIFRGGTALRLVYGSPRFSDDLDFSEVRGIPAGNFNQVIYLIVKKYANISLSDLWSKRFTHIAEFRVKEAWLPRAFKVKIEVRKGETQKKEFELKLITSPVAPLQVLGNTATMQQIFKEKLLALKERQAARDLFDLWFLGQKLNIKVDTKKYAFERRVLKAELRKYLPRKFWKAVETL